MAVVGFHPAGHFLPHCVHLPEYYYRILATRDQLLCVVSVRQRRNLVAEIIVFILDHNFQNKQIKYYWLYLYQYLLMALQFVNRAPFAAHIPNNDGLIACTAEQQLWTFDPSQAPNTSWKREICSKCREEQNKFLFHFSSVSLLDVLCLYLPVCPLNVVISCTPCTSQRSIVIWPAWSPMKAYLAKASNLYGRWMLVNSIWTYDSYSMNAFVGLLIRADSSADNKLCLKISHWYK